MSGVDPRYVAALRRAVAISFFLYAVSTLTTMAGMEIFGWLTFVLVMTLTWIERSQPGRGFFRLGPDWALLGFFVAAVLALWVNGSADADWTFSLGGQRWILLVYMTAYAARASGVKENFFYPLVFVACAASLHGIVESATGWDYLRHHAIAVADSGLPRASGLFSLPTRFASSFGMVFCFIVAAVLLSLPRTLGRRTLLWSALLIVGAALLLSETRGAWIAVAIAVALICFLADRRIFFVGLLLCAFALTGLYVKSATFRERITTLTDMGYESNSDRIALWKLNSLIFKKYPIFGVGLDENERRKIEFAKAFDMPPPHQGQAHNTYLQIAAGAGALGLFCYLIFVGSFFVQTLRLWVVVPVEQIWDRVLVLGALGAQLSLHVGGLVDCNFRASEVRHLFILILGCVSYLTFKYMRSPSLGDHRA